MKPRFRAEWVVVREELVILASCLLRPMSRNSVLEEFRVRRFAGNWEEEVSTSKITILGGLIGSRFIGCGSWTACGVM